MQAGRATPGSPPRIWPGLGSTARRPCSKAAWAYCTRFRTHPIPSDCWLTSDGPLQVMRVSIKPYACCRYNHGLIDCVLQLVRTHNIKPARRGGDSPRRTQRRCAAGRRPDRAKARPEESWSMLNSAPRTRLQWRSPLAAAASTPTRPTSSHDPTVRDLMARTDCYRDASLDAVYPSQWPAAAEISLRDGRVLSTRVEFATGEPENPVRRTGTGREIRQSGERSGREPARPGQANPVDRRRA